jgi:hypothetical protein
MKKYFLLVLILTSFKISNGQNFAVANDRMNIFYIGVDNPVSIAVANYSDKSLIVKATNGKIIREDDGYIFRGEKPGVTEISIFRKSNSKLIKIGTSAFRVKNLPIPIFKIGSGRRVVSKVELASQQFVRAQLEGFDINVRFQIDSFSVCIVPNDTCKFGTLKNIGNKINEEINNEFQQLKENDVVIFKNIFAKWPDGSPMELMPVMITISK